MGEIGEPCGHRAINAEQITMLGKVDGVEAVAGKFNGVVVWVKWWNVHNIQMRINYV